MLSKKNTFTFILALLVAITQAQDLHYSQFYMAPLTLNPALTGAFNGNLRLTGNYRNQWESVLPNVPFRTIAGSAEIANSAGQTNRIGIGMHVFADKAGSLDLSRTAITMSVGYIIGLSRNHDYFISAGLQGTVNQTSFDYLKMTTQSQYESGGSSVGELFSGQNKTFVDLAVGGIWYHYKNSHLYQFAGASIFHINRPNISFQDFGEDRIYSKYVGHFGGSFRLKPRVDLVPHYIIMKQGPAFENTFGLFARFMMDEKKKSAYGGTAFSIGPYYRIVGDNVRTLGSDAIILETKLDMQSVTFGFSYDINVSGLKSASSGRGGPELSIQYIASFKHSKGGKVYCPKW